jgi:Na+/proline symporter
MIGDFERLCWIVTILASCAAGFMVYTAVFSRDIGTPQQAALAAIAVGIAAVPYVFTQGMRALSQDGRARVTARKAAKTGG